MDCHSIAGIDPGLVDTGIVVIDFMPDARELAVYADVVHKGSGVDIRKMMDNWVYQKLFVEGYRPRKNFNTNTKMIELIKEIRIELPQAKVLDNTGIKSVVKPALLRLLEIHDFPTKTNHGDLQSAARILVLGMLKDPELNQLLYTVVIDHLNGKSWSVSH